LCGKVRAHALTETQSGSFVSFQNTEQLFFGRSLKVRIELEDEQPAR